MAAMEFLKSHPGLRSMDMEGRSLGTERPSVSFGAEQGGERERFSDVFGARRVDGADDGVIDDVSRRIREGRTDAAEASEGGGDVNDGVAERPPEEAARAAERDFQTAPGEGEATAESEKASAEEAIVPVPPDALAQEIPQGADGNRAVQGAVVHTDGRDSRVDSRRTAVVSVQELASTRFPGHSASAAVAVARGALPGAPQTMPRPGAQAARPAQPIPMLSTERSGTRPTRADHARPAQAARPDVAARAEAVLDQLRAHVRAGVREATIHLRPYDLGRIDMRVRVHGNRVRASIVAESRETLSILETHAPELRAWLAGDGGPANGAAGTGVQLDLTLMDESSKDNAPWDEQPTRNPSSARIPSNSASRSSQSAQAVQLRASSPSPGGIDLVA